MCFPWQFPIPKRWSKKKLLAKTNSDERLPESQVVGTVQTNDNMKPPDICESCWKGIIANQLGLLSSSVMQGRFLDPATVGYAYKISGKDLKVNANQKCRWCSFLVQQCKSAFNFQTEEEVEVRVHRGTGSAESWFLVEVNEMTRWNGYVYTREDDPAATHIPGRNLYVDIGTKDALSLAQKLMNECADNHNDCPSPLNPSPILPSRVIDCSDPSHPHLFITSNNQHDHYVVLSYVWGENIPNKLTTYNLGAYKHEIPVKDQPQTVRDAILTTHRLGLRYLWIDSLCIIQEGDEDDKGRELQRMSNYYKGSYVAIIAASASKVSEGFLQTRKDILGATSLALPFVMPNSGKPSGVVYLSSHARIPKHMYMPEREPTHGRGWCMQEYFLSPRALIFATHTLQYYCHHGTRNIAGANNHLWTGRQLVPSMDLPKAPKTFEEKQKTQKEWKVVIGNYTKRNISHPSDKLVALAALAEEFHDSVQSPYRAGLWETTLVLDILWSKDSGKHYPSRPTAYRAPSWSWASLDGEVNLRNAYFSDKKEFVAEVRKCETTLKDPKLPFGEVTAATLVLNAKVLADCVMKPHWGIYHLRDKDELGHDDEWIDDDSGKRMEDIGLGRLDSSDEDIQKGVRQVWVVIIERREDINPGRRIIQGLLVEPVSSGALNSTEPKYRRIGFFERIGDMGKVDEWFEKLTMVEIEIV